MVDFVKPFFESLSGKIPHLSKNELLAFLALSNVLEVSHSGCLEYLLLVIGVPFLPQMRQILASRPLEASDDFYPNMSNIIQKATPMEENMGWTTEIYHIALELAVRICKSSSPVYAEWSKIYISACFFTIDEGLLRQAMDTFIRHNFTGAIWILDVLTAASEDNIMFKNVAIEYLGRMCCSLSKNVDCMGECRSCDLGDSFDGHLLNWTPFSSFFKHINRENELLPSIKSLTRVISHFRINCFEDREIIKDICLNGLLHSSREVRLLIG